MNKRNPYSRLHLVTISLGWSIMIFSLSELGILLLKSWVFLLITFFSTGLFVLYSKFGLYRVKHHWTYKKFVIVTASFLVVIAILFNKIILITSSYFYEIAYTCEVVIFLLFSISIAYLKKEKKDGAL